MTMPWYLILGVGVILGVLATRAAIVLAEYLPSRPVEPAVRTELPEAVRAPSAADILGYRDIGGQYHAPTWPGARHARNSAAALTAWDARQSQENAA